MGPFLRTFLVVFAASAALPALPQPAALRFPIQRFVVTGANPLGAEETQRLLQPYTRADADSQVLQEAVAALQAALQRGGHELHQVVLPPQDLTGTVTLDVVSVTLSSVRVEGLNLRSEANIRRALPELREGESPNLRRLAVQTALANANPSRRVDVRVAPAEGATQIDATVRVTESTPWSVSLGVANTGSRVTGRDRVTLAASHSNLFDRDHQVEAAVTTSLERPNDVRQYGLGYVVPLYRQGAMASARYTRSNVVGNFGTFTSTGAGHVLQLAYSLRLAPREGRSSDVTFFIEDKVFDATLIDGVAVGVDRRSRPLKLAYSIRLSTLAHVLAANVELAANTATGRGNDLVSYQAEYPGISTARWKALRGGVDAGTTRGSTWSWWARAQWQYSPDSLISGEQFGLGGVGSVRGTIVDRPIAGDSGLAVSFEVTSPELAGGLRAAAFVDAGWLHNHDSDGFQRLSSDSIAGAGVGLRYTRGFMSATADYAQLLRGSGVPKSINSFAPRPGDHRLYLNLGMRF